MDPIEKAYREGYLEALTDVQKILQRNFSTINALKEATSDGVTTDEKKSKGVKNG